MSEHIDTLISVTSEYGFFRTTEDYAALASGDLFTRSRAQRDLRAALALAIVECETENISEDEFGNRVDVMRLLFAHVYPMGGFGAELLGDLSSATVNVLV